MQRRYFGVGYMEKETCVDGWRIVERVEAPPGDIPVLLSLVSVANTGNLPREITLVEYWGVNLHILLPFPIMTHGLGHLARVWRRRFNRHFIQSAHADSTAAMLWLEYRPKRPGKTPSRAAFTWGDYHPNTVFLAALDPDVPRAFISDSKAFFGDGSPSEVPGLSGAAEHTPVRDRSARFLMSVLSATTISRRRGYGFGIRRARPSGTDQRTAHRYREPTATGIPENRTIRMMRMWPPYISAPGCGTT